MSPWVVAIVTFVVVVAVAYALLSLWVGRKAQEFVERIRKYTGPY